MRYSTAAVLVLFAATLAIAIADEVFVVSGAPNYQTVWTGTKNALDGVESCLFGAVGVLIIARRGNAVGWLMSALGLLWGLMAASEAYRVMLSPTPYLVVGPFWTAPWWVLIGGFAWLFGLTLLAVFVQVFPDGRPLSRGWRIPLALTFGLPLLFLAVSTFSPVVPSEQGMRPNPNGLQGPLGDAMLALTDTLGPAALLVALMAVASVVLRFRRSDGRRRAQLKWFAYGAAVVLATQALSALLLPTDASYVANTLILLVLPLSVAAAILRHGLYDIDVVIERTLVYGVTTAAIAAAFFGGIVVLQTLLRPFTAGSEIAVAGSTLASFALFQPLRRRIQRAVDRRFYRSRYDAERTLDDFSVRLRDEVDLDAVGAELVDAAQRTMQPAHASVWLRETPR